MTSFREMIYSLAYSEIKAGEEAKLEGNIGQAKVQARRACAMAIEHWLEIKPNKNWGATETSLLTRLQEDHTIPKEIRDAANRLVKRSDQILDKSLEDNPIEDGKLIVEYFLDERHFTK